MSIKTTNIFFSFAVPASGGVSERQKNVFDVAVNRNKKAKKQRFALTSNSCGICGCIFDDKAVGGQGRNGACDCWCRQTTSWKLI